MQLVSKKNFIILLATILVVGFGLMSMYLNNKKIKKVNMEATSPAIVTPIPLGNTDSPTEIEKDLDNTDPDALDKELKGMEDELKTP